LLGFEPRTIAPVNRRTNNSASWLILVLSVDSCKTKEKLKNDWEEGDYLHSDYEFT
jgi:hypothetical protein